MKVVVVGLGISGRAAVRYLLHKGESVVGLNRTSVEVNELPVISDLEPVNLRGVDYVIKSPGVSPHHEWIKQAYLQEIPVMGEIDLAFAELKNQERLLIGITGSNGKTTTTLMTAHLLNLKGLKTVAVGNVGAPLIDYIHTDYDAFVIELSSFQLEEIREHQVLDRAVILNITPNHLDRYTSFTDYINAKLNILKCLKKESPFFISHHVLKTIQLHSYTYSSDHWGIPLDSFLFFDSFKEKVETILSLGYRDSSSHFFPHDLENIAAAYALSEVQESILKEGCDTFIRPPHRLENVGLADGVRFVNDSKATSVDAVIKAVQALEGPIILIAGGVDKGGAFQEWIPYFKNKVLKVYVLGEAADRIKRELGLEISVEKIQALKEGIYKAAHFGGSGSTVLLSPGCSSYDQFKDYQERGETFRKIVTELVEGKV